MVKPKVTSKQVARTDGFDLRSPNRVFRNLRGAARANLAAALFAITVPVQSQTVVKLDPPELKLVDKAGVNLVSGLPQFSVHGVEIGPAGNKLSHSLTFSGTSPDNFEFSDVHRGVIHVPAFPWTICPDGTNCPNVLVRLGGAAERFFLNNGVYGNFHENGASLSRSAGGTYTYTRNDGTTFTASPSVRSTWCVSMPGAGDCAGVVEVNRPDGLKTSISYQQVSFSGQTYWRPLAVHRNDGYQLRYQYAAGSSTNPTSYYSATSPTQVIALNAAVEYCDATAASCSLALSWPGVTYSFAPSGSTQSVFTVIDGGGQTTRFTNTDLGLGEWRVTAVKRASSAASDTDLYRYSDYTVCVAVYADRDERIFTWDCNALRRKLVSSVTIDSGVWTYSFFRPQIPYNNTWEASGVDPNGYRMYARTDSFQNGVNYINNASFGQTIGTYTWNIPNRLSTVKDQEGREFALLYDSRGNVIEKRQKAVPGSGLADVVQTAGYDAVCGNPVKCNKPNWTRDAMGNQTDYTYDPVHGGVLTETSPPDSRGFRPQKRYTYVQRYAWVKNASGGFVRESTPIWKLNSVSFCRDSAYTGSACAVAGDEVVTQYEYGPDAGPNNLLLRGQVVIADGASRRTCYGYDVRGNKISETTPGAALTSCP